MTEFYKKLIDLYAAGELTDELAADMESAAAIDPVLAHDMRTLKSTFETLKNLPQPHLTEESDYRILLKMQIRGAEVQRRSPDRSHWQYHLPISS
ncbi:MAG: hypothetical protein JNM34_04315 [Chthonomonadaceae bacterium]|jgi:anti-sigma factor RsiW|nr:hypothetical protein [Chthonomonadaceae bacterium]